MNTSDENAAEKRLQVEAWVCLVALGYVDMERKAHANDVKIIL